MCKMKASQQIFECPPPIQAMVGLDNKILWIESVNKYADPEVLKIEHKHLELQRV